jgi:hypothetical protein
MTLRTAWLVVAAVVGATAPATAADYELGELVLDTPWVRATPPAAEVAGGYVTITNTGEDAVRLVGGEAAFAARVEIHEMAMRDGVMRMRALADGLAIPAGETVALEPGGYHVMFMELTAPLAAGDTVRATLRFEPKGAIELPFAVAPLGASRPPAE